MVFAIADNIISPLGETTRDNYRAVEAGLSAIRNYSHCRGLHEGELSASLFSDSMRQRFMRNGYSSYELLAAASASKAIADCGLDATRSDVALILSTTKGSIAALDGTEPEAPRTGLGESAVAVARLLGVSTEPITVSNACISGVSALILGMRLIESGYCNYAIVCGAEVMSPFILSGFLSLHAVSKTECRPFDIDRNGLNPGEAAATIILGKAATTSATHWKLLRGAIRNDAYHISAPSRQGEGAFRALTSVLSKDAKHKVAFVSVHGTATLFNDQMESVAINRAGLSDVPASGIKGIYGHTMGAAGVLETALSMAALDEGIVIGTRGFREPGVSGHINISASDRHTDRPAFLKMLSGFGGGNAALLVSREGTSDPVGRLQTHITHSVKINPDSVEVDGKLLNYDSTGSKLITTIFHREVADYPRFFRMDPLARLGFVASELLLKAEGGVRFRQRDDRAVVLFNAHSSAHADKAYLQSLCPTDYYPSPSLFVYTLPNIVCGEIAIRNNWHGETCFYVLPAHNERLMDDIAKATFCDPATQSILTGWLEYDSDESFVAELHITEKIS